jgi:RNA polymerase subunit RPABC4/transcription elongation factor Spt4
MSDFIIECSSCQKKLANLRVDEKEAIDWKIKASCPYCGDTSFTQEFRGLFQYCGIEKEIDGVFQPETIVSDAEITDNYIFLKVNKV